MSTTAQVFARICGLTPEKDAWAYGIKLDRNDIPERRLTATSPLAESPTAGWLEALVMHENFYTLKKSISTLGGFVCAHNYSYAVHHAAHPTHAVALALIASDPALKAELRACSDAGNYEEMLK